MTDSVRNWFSFWKERVPVFIYAIFAIGLSFSTSLLMDSEIENVNNVFGILWNISTMICMRFMDEIKDVEKDKVGHPERPVPSGRISVQSIKKWIYVIVSSLFVMTFFIWKYEDETLAYFLFAHTVSIVLFYNEFFLYHFNEKVFIVEVLVDQILNLFMILTLCTIHDQNAYKRPESYIYFMIIFGSFLTYEFCRKMDLTMAHELLPYFHLYGKFWALVFTLLSCSTNIIGMVLFVVYYDFQVYNLYVTILVNIFILIFSTSTLYFEKPHHIPEVIALLNLIYCLYFTMELA